MFYHFNWRFWFPNQGLNIFQWTTHSHPVLSSLELGIVEAPRVAVHHLTHSLVARQVLQEVRSVPWLQSRFLLFMGGQVCLCIICRNQVSLRLPFFNTDFFTRRSGFVFQQQPPRFWSWLLDKCFIRGLGVRSMISPPHPPTQTVTNRSGDAFGDGVLLRGEGQGALDTGRSDGSSCRTAHISVNRVQTCAETSFNRYASTFRIAMKNTAKKQRSFVTFLLKRQK